MTTPIAKSALIVSGGWEGHEPMKVGLRFQSALEAHGYRVENATDLAVYDDETLGGFDLIVPNWTMDTLSDERAARLSAAIRSGTGLAGAHGGMGDSFRGCLEYNWMVGGQFLGHPHVGPYSVSLTGRDNGLFDGLPRAFDYESEQYYMMVDPAVTVLADTVYDHDGHSCRMPVIWRRQWGKGRVFYSALGHQDAEYDRYPDVLEMLIRGMLWASR